MDDQKEMFIVVDKHDHIKGYYTRYQCHHNKQLIHRVISIVVFNDLGQILLQKRGKNKDTNPCFYTISTSGHVTKGQTYRQAAKRELFEELGIHASLKREKKFIVETDIETEINCVYSTQHNGPFYPNKEEVDKVEFVEIAKLKSMLPKLTPFAITSLKQLGLL